MPVVGRFAPTPSGHLHLGNALAFGAAWLSARRQGGRVLLRIEDLDRGRAREEIAQAQREDLRWLGLDWDEEVPPQSQRAYSLVGLPTYRCDCSRARRLAGECTCRDRPAARGAWRLRLPPAEVGFEDLRRGFLRLPPGDDPVLMRADGEAAYPLAVVLDDARDGVTEVVRGADLLEATPAQVVLHGLLGLPIPRYLHIPVLLGPDGRKLSKSHGATELRALRRAGWSANQVWRLLLPALGTQAPLERAVLDPAAVLLGPLRVDGEPPRLRDLAGHGTMEPE